MHEQFGAQYRLPSLCALAPLPLPGVRCVCTCCRRPDKFADSVGCDHQCCRRHMPRAQLLQRCAQFAGEIGAVLEEPGGVDSRSRMFLDEVDDGERERRRRCFAALAVDEWEPGDEEAMIEC